MAGGQNGPGGPNLLSLGAGTTLDGRLTIHPVNGGGRIGTTCAAGRGPLCRGGSAADIAWQGGCCRRLRASTWPLCRLGDVKTHIPTRYRTAVPNPTQPWCLLPAVAKPAQVRNCEDIAMQLLVSNTTREAPIFVHSPRWGGVGLTGTQPCWSMTPAPTWLGSSQLQYSYKVYTAGPYLQGWAPSFKV